MVGTPRCDVRERVISERRIVEEGARCVSFHSLIGNHIHRFCIGLHVMHPGVVGSQRRKVRRKVGQD